MPETTTNPAERADVSAAATMIEIAGSGPAPVLVELYVATRGERAGQVIISAGQIATGKQRDREGLQTLMDLGEIARLRDNGEQPLDIARKAAARIPTYLTR